MLFDEQETNMLERASGLLRAITHPLRISMLNFIHENEPVQVQNIHSGLNLDQSITSQHLKILRDSGLVTTDREGKFIYYQINRNAMLRSLETIRRFDETTLSSRKKKR